MRAAQARTGSVLLNIALTVLAAISSTGILTAAWLGHGHHWSRCAGKHLGVLIAMHARGSRQCGKPTVRHTPGVSARAPESVTGTIKRMTTCEGGSTEEVLMTPVSDIPYLREIAEHHGVEVVETKSTGVEPVSTIAVVVVGSVLAVNTVSRLLEERKGGQVIDMRAPANLAVFRSRHVQYGLIVVLAADGTVTVQCKDSQDKLGLLVECLSGLATRKVDAKTNAIAEAARGQLGADVEITTGPPAARD